MSRRIVYRAESSAYDSFADVLFVRLGTATRTLGVDTPGGFVVDYSVPDRRVTGVTVIGFRRRFPDFSGTLCVDAPQPFEVVVNADTHSHAACG